MVENLVPSLETLAKEVVLASGRFPGERHSLQILAGVSGPQAGLMGSDPDLGVWVAEALGVDDSESLEPL